MPRKLLFSWVALMGLFCAAGFAQELSTSRISAHLIGNYTSGSSNIVYGRPRVLKVLGLDSGWPSGMVAAMRDYKAKAPGGKIVARIYSPKQYYVTDDPTWAAGDFWTNILKKSLDFLAPEDRALIDYLEGPNEGQTPTLGYPDDSASLWFNQFWTNLTPRIVAAGCKPCIGSIAVGNPGGNMTGNLAAFVPALRQARMAGGAWSYHAYTVQYTTDIAVEYWYSLRYRQFYGFFAASYPDLADMPLILTEGGVDNTGDPNNSGWRARGSAADYQRWLNWFDQQLGRDAYVLGCTLFQNGDPGGWWSFDLEPISTWLRDYLLPPMAPPAAPSGLAASNGAYGIVLSWTNAPLNPCSYTVRRATSASGPFWVLATNITTGVRATAFLDSSAAPETDYFYRVSASNAAGQGPSSAVLAARLSLPFPSAINCGGGEIGSFMEDIYFDGGTSYTTANSVSTNGLLDPAPIDVYRSQRYGNVTYRLKAGSPRTAYKLRLHFAEIWWTASGQRVFDVFVNDAPVMESFDIFSVAGGAFKGTIREFNAISDSAGEIAVRFANKVDNASINGIELIAAATNAPPATPQGVTAQVGNALVNIRWTMPSGATSCSVHRSLVSGGPFAVIASNLTAAAYQDVSFVANNTYYYVVTASNPAGQSPPSMEVSARPTNGLPDVVITGVGWSPSVLSNGTKAVFWARVFNRGSAPTPVGTPVGVGFNMDGAGTVSWSSAFSGPLTVNSSILLTADGGPTGNYWTATRGTHRLIATVDDINRFPESIESNNAFATNLYVFSPRPVITSCVLSNSAAIVTWRAIAGAGYVLEGADDLISGPWQSGDPIVATGTNASSPWNGLSTKKFFRVVQFD